MQPDNEANNQTQKDSKNSSKSFSSVLGNTLDRYYYQGLFHGIALGSLATFLVLRR